MDMLHARPAGAPRPHAVQARRGVHGQGRRGHHRRRVHGPAHARPPLVRRPAPGHRGQGRGEDRGREPDPGHDHVPELLPHVREAGRHDRHRRHRGRGVRQDLQTGSGRDPAQQADDPQGHARPGLPDRAGEVHGHRRGDQGDCTRRASRSWSARSPSRNRSSSRPRSSARASRTSSSTPSTTRRKRRSSRRPAARARSRLPRTWPAAARTSSSAATPSSWHAQKTREVEDAGASEKRIEAGHQPAVADGPRGRRRLGGLHILGTERHESRRIDNQLRGRSGRQGDPGSSRFYLSLEDDLMRIFGSDRISGDHAAPGHGGGRAHRARHGHPRHRSAPRKQVEGHNFDVRKHLLEYDDVMNKQRESIYTLRRAILDGREGKEYSSTSPTRSSSSSSHALPRGSARASERVELNAELYDFFGVDLKTASVDLAAIAARKSPKSSRSRQPPLRAEGSAIGPEDMRLHEKYLLLQVIDQQWKDHLLAIDHLKEGIGLRGYGQRDPLRVQEGILRPLPGNDGARPGPRLQVPLEDRSRRRARRRTARSAARPALPSAGAKQQPMFFSGSGGPSTQTVKHREVKVGRNTPARAGRARSTRSAMVPRHSLNRMPEDPTAGH